MPDFDSVVIKTPWSAAALHAISVAGIFGLIPLWFGQANFVWLFLSFAAVGWVVGLFVMKRTRFAAAGRDGLRLGSVRVLWRNIHSPAFEGDRIRVINASGKHLHIPSAACRDAEYRKFIETNAPAGHELVKFLGSHAAKWAPNN